MSDRKVAKNRLHKGISAYVRKTLREVGISLDEEMAQFALGGVNPFSGRVRDYLAEVVASALTDRRQHMRQWEADHPGRNAYPPSFPERCLKLVREAIDQSLTDDTNAVAYTLERIRVMCEAELDTELTTTEVPEED